MRKDPDAWWTVIVTDPIVVHVVPYVLRIRWLTANVITGLSVLIAIGSGVCFLAGIPIAGALLFEAARFADVMDGKVARLRGTSSARGGFFDVAGDFVRMAWVYSAVGIWLAERGKIPELLALLPALIVLGWLWSSVQLQLHRDPVVTQAAPAESSGVANGGWLARHRLTRYPGSVDAAGAALTVAPLSANPTVMVVVLWAVIGLFYLPAALRNVVKVFRVLGAEDKLHRSDASDVSDDVSEPR